MNENQIHLRPTEQHCSRFYVELDSCPTELIQITAYPPIRVNKRDGPEVDGGFLCLHRLQDHCRDTHSLRAKIARAWRAFRGCPDTSVCFEMLEDVERVITAIQEAMPIAFPEKEHHA